MKHKQVHLQAFFDAVESRACAVVAMPARFAADLLQTPTKLYTNYHTQVRAGARLAADLPNDQHRSAVDALLFGSFAEKITFAALSLDGLSTSGYGEIHLVLKKVAIQERATLLIRNSYHFVEEHKLSPGKKIPPRSRAGWEDRSKLAVVKCASQLSGKTKPTDFAKILLRDGQGNRATDEFIEVHIFGSFNRDSIADVKVDEQRRLTGQTKMDAKLALRHFRNVKK